MNLSKFRTAHSIVMEHYQFIEMHLEGIYAALSGRSFYERLKEEGARLLQHIKNVF